MKSIFLSVIIPSFNEKKNLKRGVLESVRDYLSKQNYSWEVILSDDQSTDGTTELLKKFVQDNKGFHVLENRHGGKGPTVSKGILAAVGKWRLFSDFDQSTPINELEKFIKHTDKHDFIIASREGAGAKRYKEPWYRHFIGRGFNFLIRIITGLKIKDTQCGFKLIEGKLAEKIIKKLIVYKPSRASKRAFTGAFDVELLYLAKKFKKPIHAIPVKWSHHETNRVNPIIDSVLMLIDIIKIRATDLLGKYD